MGHRLSKIYTKTGDKGTTAVSDGKRISKSHPRIRALGAVDQLNAQIGLLLCEAIPGAVAQRLQSVQHILFDMGGELSMPELTSVTEEDIAALETEIDSMNEQLPPLKEFILPGGSKAAALCHIARTQCRLTETNIIELAESKPDPEIRAELIAYINRLSDWLFVAARLILKQACVPEVLWKNSFSRSK